MQQNKMGVWPVPRLVWNMSLPLMLSLLVQSLYNIVDGIFVARLSEDALTATTLAFPVQLLMVAVAVGTSVGINALLSRTIGAQRYGEAGQIATTGVLLAAASALVFSLSGAFFVEGFVGLFSADPAIAPLACQYLRICMLFCFGTFLETMCQRFLQAVGDTFLSMVSLVVGAGANILLDPLLIFGLCGLPALGIRGAAIATVLGQWLGAGVALGLHLRKNKQIRLSLRGFRLQKSTLAAIYQVGAPTIVTQALGSMMLCVMNTLLMPFSSTAVAFFGVYYKLQSFLFMPMNGLGQAAIPIIGFNYGARRPARIRQTLRTMLPAAAGLALLGTALFLLFPRQLLGLFSPSAEMLALGVPALRIAAVPFVLTAVTIVLGYAASGLGNGLINMAATALRQLVLLAPCAFLFARLGGVGRVWYALWSSEALAALFAVLRARRLFARQLSALDTQSAAHSPT